MAETTVAGVARKGPPKAAATICQREIALWAAVRKLRFTASNFRHILSVFDRKKIWLHESGVLGATPDGFVEGVFRGVIHQQHYQATCSANINEVKCPYTAIVMIILINLLMDGFPSKCLKRLAPFNYYAD
ncbi:hypothetical protein DPMN_104117 [Dreissena polymorpha]|uniref:Uncharacterized protein n=1 Tax=Dreissena polymorpha TaxID=45954 RepID=A0A9D4HCD9_DREPO|nr:hypothetical protein DPMN_104117 [Dreissena polymorpha]